MRVRAIPPPRRLLWLARHLMITASVCGTLLHVVILASMWSTAAAPWLAVLAVVTVSGNIALTAPGYRWFGPERAEAVRAVFNVVIHAGLGVISGWGQPAWLLLPFVTSITAAPPSQQVWARVVAIVIVFDGTALATGGRAIDAVTFTGVSLFIQLLLSAHLELTTNLLAERDRTLAELDAAQRHAVAQEKLASVGQLAAGVAHEINNPMCFVTANVADLLDELRRAPALPATLVEYRDQIIPETVDGIARVNAIVGDMRRFARSDPEPLVTFALASEIVATTRLARTQLGPGQHLHVDVDADLWLHGSPRQLDQALLNLIVNAIQALPGPGDIRVRGRAIDDDQLELTVADTGTGMGPETLARLFEPFFTTRPVGSGVGLGLAVVHGVAAAHGGRIDVDSALGAGSTFRLVLPRARRSASDGAARSR